MRGNVALIKKDIGIVENIIVVGELFNPPVGYQIQSLPEDYNVHIGDIWDGDKYIDTHTEKMLLANLSPTKEEVSQAKSELKMIDLLLEMEVIQ